jgi:hypothetical protein
MRLIERCRASERRDADLAPGRDVPLWGWARRGGGATAVAEEEGAVDGEEQGGAGLDVAQEEALLDEIKADPAFGWSWADEGKAAVEIKIKGPGSNVAFQVTRRRGPDGVVYEAECLGDAKEKLVISRYLSRRPRKTDFRLLLVCPAFNPYIRSVLTWLEHAALVQDTEECEMCPLSKASRRSWAYGLGSAAACHARTTWQRY